MRNFARSTLTSREGTVTQSIFGPKTEFGQAIHAMKYRAPEETFDDYCVRYARTTADDEWHFRRLIRYLRNQQMLPAGRQQLAVGRPYQTTAFNCFVGASVPDDTEGIFEAVKRGALTLRSGGGVGWDFSTLRPSGEPIRGLGHGAVASGPVSFMHVWNSMCGTIMSAGERRGAMMGVLRVDHPDILKFVRAKQDQETLKNFNISVAVTDDFMEALASDGLYDLKFGATKFGQVRAEDVWAAIMENNWDYAEPGVLFIDRINEWNPLWYCEKIAATNPCAEQPLPPSGACLLGSINLVKLLVPAHEANGPALAAAAGKQVVRYELDLELLDDVTDAMVRAFDNVIDRTTYPLEEQRLEALAKRRMGIGVTGMANALEVMGMPYATPEYLDAQDRVLKLIMARAYRTSAELARKKGPFPKWDADSYCAGRFFLERLPGELSDEIRKSGLRNGLLTSIAPTGTISMAADNVSSGIEPVYALRAERLIFTPTGQRAFSTVDHALEFYGVEGRTADRVTAEEHIDVLCRAQRYVDSSISKTCNVAGQVGGEGPGVSYSDFKKLYLRAWAGGAKGCTTFNINGKRVGIMKSADPSDEGAACVFDAATGTRSCE
jgi:ribonucleoside-diphosphate reductase alpha chain